MTDCEFFEFFEDLKKADAECEGACLEKIDDAIKSGSWQAAAWKLERKFKSDWGRFEKVALTDQTGKNEFTGISEARQRVGEGIDKILVKYGDIHDLPNGK